MFLNNILTEAELTQLLETPLEMPENATLIDQLDTLGGRIGAAKKALGIANKLTNPEERKRHRGRVLTFLNQLRPAFERVLRQLKDEMWQEQTPNPEMMARI